MKKLNHIITVLLLTATGHAYAQTADRDTLFLEESVVIGMDVQKRNTITAAVFTVKADAVSGRPVTDLTHALQGNVPGLETEVAKEIGISQAQVSRLEKGALDKIKSHRKVII